MIKIKAGNKKGDFGVEEFAGLVLGIIALIIVGYIALKLWNNYNTNQENEAALGLMNTLEAKINALQSGEKGVFLFTWPKTKSEWYIAGWDTTATEMIKRPNKCLGYSCICICPKEEGNVRGAGTWLSRLINDQKGLISSKNELLESCERRGICRKMAEDKLFVADNFNSLTIDLNNLDSGGVDPVTGQSSSGNRETYCIYSPLSLETPAVEITVNKSADGTLRIEKYTELYKKYGGDGNSICTGGYSTQ